MRLVRLPLPALLVTVLAACGGGGDGGTPPARTPASVTVAVSSAAPMTAFGQTRTLTAEVRDANQQVIPNATVTWARDVNDKVTLSTTTGLTTVATATANGAVDITATSGTVSSSPATRLVVDQVLNAVSISPTAPVVAIGRTRQLSVAPTDANNQAITHSYQAQFSSNNTSVATVAATSTSGAEVTGVSNGTAGITGSVTINGVTRSATSTANVQTVQTNETVNATSASTFDPSLVNVLSGGSVTWAWNPTVAHNVLFDSPGAPANIPGNNTAGSTPRTFPNAGTYNYHCGIHATMTGTVVVH
ncbi:MAG TPA: plastocyanin/azurin family copper-binding protein [Gemmatimonadaceae bacterium]|nr:plastocyanin/azurin family copper-binding protein [Gemmatimonadaceae bacterium]